MNACSSRHSGLLSSSRRKSSDERCRARRVGSYPRRRNVGQGRAASSQHHCALGEKPSFSCFPYNWGSRWPPLCTHTLCEPPGVSVKAHEWSVSSSSRFRPQGARGAGPSPAPQPGPRTGTLPPAQPLPPGARARPPAGEPRERGKGDHRPRGAPQRRW